MRNRFTPTHRPFVLVAGVGLLGLIVNTIALVMLREQLGLPLLLASLLAGEIGVLHNYLLHQVWTFQRGKVRLRHALLFHMMALATLATTSVLLIGIVQLIGLPYPVANVIAVPIASAFNYFLIARWIWPDLPVRGPATKPLHHFVHNASGALARLVTRSASLMAVLPIALVCAWVIWYKPGGWGLLAALLLGAAFVVRPGVAARPATIMVLAVTVGITTLNYMTWRAELINWASWWISVPLFAAELFGALHTLGLQYTVWPRAEPAVHATEDPTRQPIFIFIPTVDEGRTILYPTIRGALLARARYLAKNPHGSVAIVVCNDGRVANKPNWRDTEILASEMGVVCVTRLVGGGAKAGNIEHARQQVGATGNALVVIFDADQIAEPEFLLETVPHFADASIGWVQSGQYYSNLSNPVARWSNDQQALFYQVLCPGKAVQNAAFICGTNVVLRAKALDEIGGLPQNSVTEDFAASIELHPRWRSIFLKEVLARGLGPMDLPSYFKQQRRWAIGTLGVLRSHWRHIFLPEGGGLRLAQRVQYTLACTHYLSGLRDFVYLIAPLAFLITGYAAVRGATLEAFLWHFLPYWLASQSAFWYIAWRKTSLRGIIIGFGSFPVLLGSLLTVVTGRQVGFTVTAKHRTATGAWRPLLPHILSVIACVATLGFVVWSGRFDAPEIISAIWVVYTLLMLGAMLWLGWADQQTARQPDLAVGRVTQVLPVVRPQPQARAMRPVALGATAFAVVGLMLGRQAFVSPPTPFELSQSGTPYLGISVPYQLLDRPTALERELGLEFAIEGRTQDINDTFDRAWAERLEAEGARPWVTLLFGVDKPSLESGLPAIANGVHDDKLRNWARAIRDYNQPVYLTVLPHVDRNWSISSAVANGGIPQDAPRAWERVQSVFMQEGATNVAWVWAPADPINDQEYAPLAATIDAVLISMISYPDAEWGRPAQTLQAVEARHPTTPLMLEVSAAGNEARKVEWLQSVGAAVSQSSAVHALLYHEGSPNDRATPDEVQAWSMASTPETLAAMRAAALDAEAQTSMRTDDPRH